MTPDQRERLRSITDFPALVEYLHDELDWPVSNADFEDLVFEYTADELGIDSASAAKIQGIKRLRPLSVAQPWGIFFVEFEPKQLPVVALRRILSGVIVKNRASAAPSDRRLWALDDLLFISNYGEGNTRRISFAHFSQPEDGRALPTLKVLGWDNLDTPLHLDDVADRLRDWLAWPDDEHDVNAWRNSWASAFVVRHREAITTAQELSVRLAQVARAVRDRINTALSIETEAGPLTRLMRAFQAALIHDLDVDGFADMYAQTIAYGLFSARVTDPNAKTIDDLASHMRTNPLLKELMSTLLRTAGTGAHAGEADIDFDELGVSDLIELLDDANMDAVLRDFGDRNRLEDPVIHFYEGFARDYDPLDKVKRGEFYTPLPVVAYIVRSVDEHLRIQLGLDDGLADTTTWAEMVKRHPSLTIPTGMAPDDHFVQILDPATGTGTFLVEAIAVIHETLLKKWADERLDADAVQARWNEYVNKHLLTRLYAYELKMAPYAIAHLKVGLKLHETGYRFDSNERARVFLTNALEPAAYSSQQVLSGLAPALAHEAAAVQQVKLHHHFTVVIGNPPYSNFSANLSDEVRALVDKYRSFAGAPIRERNQLQFERNLQDDYVKFVSLAEEHISKSGVGVVGYITNASMLMSPSLRGMRERLFRQFDQIQELHLHGGQNEIGSQAAGDQNVFEIAQAVAIHLYVRCPTQASGKHVKFSECWGSRREKQEFLSGHAAGNTPWQAVQPDSRSCSFVPQDPDSALEAMRVDEVFSQFGAGIKTSRDAVAIGFTPEVVAEQVEHFRPTMEADAGDGVVQPLVYRPFDRRFVFYDEDVVASRSWPTMQHMLAGSNIGLVGSSSWTTPDRFSVGVSRLMVEMKTGTHDRGTTIFPLYRYESILGGPKERILNFTPEFVKRWRATTGLVIGEAPSADGSVVVAGEEVFAWILGVAHSSEYRAHMKAQLAQGFPIVLFPASQSLLEEISALGRRLIRLYAMDPDADVDARTSYSGVESPTVGKVGWLDGTVWLDAPSTLRGIASAPGTSGFSDVPSNVWAHFVAGYQVCDKWLKDRRGRTLDRDEIDTYARIVDCLRTSLDVVAKIDATLGQFGGWPSTFVSSAREPELSIEPDPATRLWGDGTQLRGVFKEDSGD